MLYAEGRGGEGFDTTGFEFAAGLETFPRAGHLDDHSGQVEDLAAGVNRDRTVLWRISVGLFLKEMDEGKEETYAARSRRSSGSSKHIGGWP